MLTNKHNFFCSFIHLNFSGEIVLILRITGGFVFFVIGYQMLFEGIHGSINAWDLN